jgi:hypothetical protein
MLILSFVVESIPGVVNPATATTNVSSPGLLSKSASRNQFQCSSLKFGVACARDETDASYYRR